MAFESFLLRSISGKMNHARRFLRKAVLNCFSFFFPRLGGIARRESTRSIRVFGTNVADDERHGPWANHDKMNEACASSSPQSRLSTFSRRRFASAGNTVAHHAAKNAESLQLRTSARSPYQYLAAKSYSAHAQWIKMAAPRRRILCATSLSWERVRSVRYFFVYGSHCACSEHLSRRRRLLPVLGSAMFDYSAVAIFREIMCAPQTSTAQWLCIFPPGGSRTEKV